MISKKVPGFTIMEVTIAMLLSALVIGISYTVFSLVTRTYRTYQLKHQEMANVLRLDELLQMDFGRAEVVLKDTDGIALKNSNRVIKYSFYPDYVLRRGITVDTFRVKTDSITMLFESKALNGLNDIEEDNRMDELAMLISLQKEKIPYYYHKIYSSVNLINRKADAGN